VLLEADDERALKITHERYFMDLEEMLKSAIRQVDPIGAMKSSG
jgi:hypothetical protein